MLSIPALRALNEQECKVAKEAKTPPPLGEYIVMILLDSSFPSYLSKEGVVMTDRSQVSGWALAEEAWAFVAERGPFFGPYTLVVDLRSN